jgi:hypothetical protein
LLLLCLLIWKIISGRVGGRSQRLPFLTFIYRLKFDVEHELYICWIPHKSLNGVPVILHQICL